MSLLEGARQYGFFSISSRVASRLVILDMVKVSLRALGERLYIEIILVTSFLNRIMIIPVVKIVNVDFQ